MEGKDQIASESALVPNADGADECCATCTLKYRIEKMDYSKGGCEHSDPDGFICMAFSSEGLACWIVGNDPKQGMCECYCPGNE